MLFRKSRILIVDDERDFAFFVKINLEALGGYSVSVAHDAQNGLKMALRLNPELILLDIMMPKVSGLQLLKQLKENEPTMSIPVVMLSAKNDEESKLSAAGLYGDDYLVKPVPLDILQKKIESVLKRLHPTKC